MMLQYFKDLADGIEAKIAADPSSRSHRKVYALEIARLGRRLYNPEQKVAWGGVAAPFDLLNAMGVTSCFVEFVGAMLASTGAVGPMLAASEQEGFASDTCAYHRAVLGAAGQGMMPEPDFLVATTCPCSGSTAVLENLANRFDKKLFALHVPQEITGQSVDYLADQIRDMVLFVERHTGRSLDPEKLERAMNLTNEARALMVEVYDLASHVPSPASGKDMANFGIVMALFLGTEAGIEVASSLRDAFARRVAEGVSGIGEEKLRLLWVQNRIQFKHPLIDMMELEYGAAIVVDELNTINWEPIDPDDPYPGIARRCMAIPLNGPISHRIDGMKRQAEKYRIDGVINPCHFGCRQGTGARGMIQQGFREIGIPVLNLEVDCVDLRNFSEGQLKTRLEAFLEMLSGRPSPWKSEGGRA